ncbi:CHRD domain-containing protein [Methylocaldum sp.]|uniref:CHRD domain-containing protein n=1 Tax=Methylocaldum sp. TaxID=1969727 RepID=UPI002D481544|nr:CHRD domain-containing protein [Methylocaldum sp.]HYE37918.1 CHRD domain-containing protein [Methylocaldum sp.]
MKRIHLSLLFGGALAMVQPANADLYTASMSGVNEVPPNTSTATGFTSVTVEGDTLAVHVDWAGLTGGNATAAHIHCCSDPGANAGIAVGLPSFPAATSGTYENTFDLSAPSTYSDDFLNDVGGGSAEGAAAALIAALNATRAYSNIHNADFPGGEIRGNLAPIPLPPAVMLFTTALLGLLPLARRSR